MISIETCFRFLCLLCAVSMCAYCIWEYYQNRDLSDVSFQKFHGTGLNVYPQISLCFSHEYSESGLKNINKDFTSSSYDLFLKGRIWDDRMLDLDYEKVITRPEDHLLHICGQSFFNGPCDVKTEISSHVYFWGVNCLSFHAVPDKRLFAASMWINSSIFLNNRVRPQYDHKFVVSLSYPQQVLKFAYHQGHWDMRNATENYSMFYKVKDVEVLRRRDKFLEKCSDWKHYDDMVEEQALSYVGCRPFRGKTDNYLSLLETYPSCKSKENIQLMNMVVFDDIIADSQNNLNFTPPCSEIKRINVIYVEEVTNVGREKLLYPSTESKLNDQGWFRVTVMFPTNEFKEIKQMRGYNAENLVGNSGGYIGLLVGYTVAEIPALFRIIQRRIIEVMKSNGSPGKFDN